MEQNFYMIFKQNLPFKDQCPSRIEASQLICRANQLACFYMRGTLVVKGFLLHDPNILGEYIFISYSRKKILIIRKETGTGVFL